MKKPPFFVMTTKLNIDKEQFLNIENGSKISSFRNLFERFFAARTLFLVIYLIASMSVFQQIHAQNLLNGSGLKSVTADGSNEFFTVPLSTNAPNCTGQVSITFSYGLQNGNPNNGGCCGGVSSREMELSLVVNGTTYWVARSPNDDNTTTGIGTGGTAFANHQPANGATCSGCVTSSYPMLGSNQTLATNQTITLTLPAGVTLSAANSVRFRFNNLRIAGNAPEDNAIINVTNVSMPNCPAPCSAGTTAPTLSATTKSNVCPATTADLSSLVTSSCPVGSTLEWHNVSTSLSAANKVANPATVGAGTYYPACFDATNSCYSPVPATGVTVSINTCSTLCNINSTAFNVGLKTNYNINTVSSCNTEIIAPNTPFETTAIVRTDAQGKLGIAYVFWVNAQTSPSNNLPACASSTSTSLAYQLYLKDGSGQCTGSPIPATVANGGLGTGTYAGLNPEWSGLQPDTDYVIKVTGVVGAVCINMFRSCLYYYQFPCSAGTTAPVLTSTSKSNICPATTADISSLVSSTCPVGSTLEWHTVSTGLAAANKVASPSSVGAGTYYPTCFDATNSCYSPVPATGVTVSINTCSTVICNGTTIGSATIAPTTGAVADTYVVNSKFSIQSLSAGGGYTDASTGYRFGTPTATTDRNYKLIFSSPVTNVVLHLGFINNDIALNSPAPAGEETIANITAVGATGAVYTFQDFSTAGMQNLWNPTTRTISSTVNSFGPNSNSKIQISSTTPFTEITLTHDYIAGTNPFGILLEDVCYEIACVAGTTAPIITATTVTNTCPTTTFSLAALTNTGTKPAGTTLIWSTHKVPTSIGDTLTNLTTVSSAGKYYALYYDKVANCYSPADSVTATLTVCAVNPPAQSATNSQPKTGNAGTELTPTGGNGTYVYSVDNTGSCTPVVGATALPTTSNLTVTNTTTGAYTYTAPSTAGTYYYCIKVCDTTTPTPSCTTKTYTLTVTCPVGSAVPTLK